MASHMVYANIHFAYSRNLPNNWRYEMNFTLSEGQPRKNRPEHRLIFSLIVQIIGLILIWFIEYIYKVIISKLLPFIYFLRTKKLIFKKLWKYNYP